MVFIAGWSSPVARQAHNLKVVRFKSHSRTQSTLQGMNLQGFSVQAVYAAKNIFERLA